MPFASHLGLITNPVVLYIVAMSHAWQIKEWLRGVSPLMGTASLWVFVVMGIAASVGGIVRGHLVFTDAMNRPHLASELARTSRMRLFTDVLLASLLTIDALMLAQQWPLTTVLTIALATGIVLAAALMEPATTAALLGK